MALSVVSVVSAQAETTSDSSSTLSPLVVTATSTPVSTADSLFSVTVIDAEEVNAQQAQQITELLAAQPGVDVSSNGGYGKTTSVYMRGAGAESTKFLLNGIPLYSATSGGAPFENIPTALIDRLEMVRGPKATLYGADAVGGVIQMFLPEAGDEPEANLAIGVGSFNTKTTEATLAGSHDNTQYLLSAGIFDTDGDIVKKGEEAQGYRNENILLNVGHQFDSGARISSLVMNSAGRNHYVGDESDYQVQVIGLGASFPVTDNWETEFNVSQARNDRTTVSSAETYATTTQTARWSNTVWADDHEFVLGAETSEDNVDVTRYQAPDRRNDAAFAQALFDFGVTSLQLNLRQDHNSAYGDSTTGGVAAGYKLDEIHRLRASYGEAFAAPTFNDLYYPGSGDPTLDATRSKTVEVGIRADYGDRYWDVAVFDASYGDLVIWSNYTGSWKAYNVDSTAQGIELSSGLTLEQWRLGAAFTWLDAKDDKTGFQLPKRAQRSARLSLDRMFEQGQIGMTLIGANGRATTLGSDEMLPGYVTLDLRASYDFAIDWNAELSVKNALDKEYQTAKDYINPGRGVFLTLNYSAF